VPGALTLARLRRAAGPRRPRRGWRSGDLRNLWNLRL